MRGNVNKKQSKLLIALGAFVLTMNSLAQDLGALYYDSIKVRVCKGTAIERHCVGMGFFCDDDNSRILNKGNSADGCRWTWIYDCDGPTLNRCQVRTTETLSMNCGPTCQLLSYNQCACSCSDLGGGFEDGFHTSCDTEKP